MIALVPILAASLLAPCSATFSACRDDCSRMHQVTVEEDELMLLQVDTNIKPGPKHYRQGQRHQGEHAHHHVETFGVHPGLGGPADAPQLLSKASRTEDYPLSPTIGAPDAFIHAGEAYNALAKVGIEEDKAYNAPNNPSNSGNNNSISAGMDRGIGPWVSGQPPPPKHKVSEQSIATAATKVQKVVNDVLTRSPSEISIFADGMGGDTQEFGQGTPFPTIDTRAGPLSLNLAVSKADQQAAADKIVQQAVQFQNAAPADMRVPEPMPANVPPPGLCPPDKQYLANGQGDGTHWRCVDGTCIESPGRCDGAQNCADGSDELYCNKALFAKVQLLESQNTDLQDEIMNLRTGGSDHTAEFDTVESLIHSLNESLTSDFGNVVKKTKPHLELQADVEANQKRVTVAQFNLDQLKQHDHNRMQNVSTLMGRHAALVEIVSELQQKSLALEEEVSVLSEEYHKLELDIHNQSNQTSA